MKVIQSSVKCNILDLLDFYKPTGMPRVSRGDLFLAYSITNRWEGSWERMGKILSHEKIPHHNQHDHFDYEWGLEGAQLVMLPSGHILLNGVCFLPEGKRGGRQRVFFAISGRVSGPYTTLGPVLTPSIEGWDSGENGHAAVVIEGSHLHLFYQAHRYKDCIPIGCTV